MLPKMVDERWITAARDARRRVLIVDDVPEICNVMRLAAERLVGPRLEVTTATSSEEGIALALRGGFDLVVSDYRMPGADGLAVLRTARCAHPAGYRWLMTGYNEVPASPTDVRAAGLDAVIQKPVTTALFFRMLRGTFGGDARLVDRLRDEAQALLYDGEVERGAPAFIRAANL